MKLDVLVAEIGSTTTVVNGFMLGEAPYFVGSGQAPTTVQDGDVTLGLHRAIDGLKKNLGDDPLSYEALLATSSAAGGLKMTVHGLAYDMTARAAKEAALGAGANIHMVTAGKLRRTDLANIQKVRPNIILLAGGVDYGERETALENAERLAALGMKVPIIYGGNKENQEEIALIFEGAGMTCYLVDNVYPRIDELNVVPTRKVIQAVFEEHITRAPGMSRVREMVSGHIMPTPAGVMAATQLLAEAIGDVLTVDVGGATTDIHSVTEGSEEMGRLMIAPEPVAKRTVEGDLGVYINMANIVEMATPELLAKRMGVDGGVLEALIRGHQPMPGSAMEKHFVEALTYEASHRALERHAGDLIDLYATTGRKKMAKGKDLTAIRYIVGTGGALTKLPGCRNILKSIVMDSNGTKLLPTQEAGVLIDRDYIMASLGVLSLSAPEASLALMKKSLGL